MCPKPCYNALLQQAFLPLHWLVPYLLTQTLAI